MRFKRRRRFSKRRRFSGSRRRRSSTRPMRIGYRMYMLLCRNPYIGYGGGAYGCGQCIPCRINRRRMWTHRIMLEATQHGVNSFWTLTYDDEKLTFTDGGLPTLVRKDLTDFIKRLREDYRPLLLRYFNVGEYGSQTERPHYHLALFNFPPCAFGSTRQKRSGNCCPICDRVRRIWGHGIIHSGKLETASAAYVAGYVTKKLTSKEDPRLKGRAPEFASMSLRPGIGAGFMDEVASTLLQHDLEQLPDVPSSLAHGGRNMPLGRYLTRRLRERVGMDPSAPESTLEAQKEKLRPLREAANQAPTYRKETFKNLIIDTYSAQAGRMENRSKIYKKRESL